LGQSKPVRQNIAKVSEEERIRLRDAILKLNSKFYPGSRDDFRPRDPGPYTPAGHVSYWFKQDEIHQATHVHGGPAFLSWHRELCNRFEHDLQAVDPSVALHYWDWTTDPRASPNGNGGTTNLFSVGPDGFMGTANGIAGEPLDSLYIGTSIGSRDVTGNAADPPEEISRFVNFGAPGAPNILSDIDIIRVGNTLPRERQFPRFRTVLEGEHGDAHNYFGDHPTKIGKWSTIKDGHTAFRDPFVFLLHSNVDRLFASWQLIEGEEWRLDPDLIYGIESNTQADGDVVGILTPLEPWAGIGAPGIEEEVLPARPWHKPENEQNRPENQKNSRHPYIVSEPPQYDGYVHLGP
jgi:Common central domain of tyrosinase